MDTPTLIVCLNLSYRFLQSAIQHGWLYGLRLPGTAHPDIPVSFADQNWRTPNRVKYMAALAQHRPAMATVLDLESKDQYATVLDWAEEAAQYVQTVILIPKVCGIIPRIPLRIGNADVVLGYSIPTTHGGTTVPLWEFAGRRIHLLGGSPHAQMAYSVIFSQSTIPEWFSARTKRFCAQWQMFGGANVVSADGNMASKMANTLAAFWQKHQGSPRWVQLAEVGRGDEHDAHYTAFDLSMQNIMDAWQELSRENESSDRETTPLSAHG